jgi:RNA polymerase sigma factor (sigma-70 family)
MEPSAGPAARVGGVLLRVQSDERLAQLASSGSHDAFETLVHRYRGGLLRSCRRILPGDRAEDAVQEALLQAHRALTRNGSPDRFRPWLHRIAVNASLRQLNQGGDTVPLSEEFDGVEGPEAVRERRERLRSTVGAIDRLPGRQRRALVLRELEGRSHAEIAHELGLSGGAVRQLIHRARNTVRSAASALTPPAFLLRMLETGSSVSPVGEAAVGGAGGAVAAKLAVAAVVAGGVAGGVAIERSVERPQGTGPAEAQESAGDSRGETLASVGDRGSGGGFWSADRSGPDRGPGGGSGSSGPGSGSSDRSGPSGDGSGSGSSGSGSGGSGDAVDPEDLGTEESGSSGSGSSGSGSSGSGSSGSGSLSSGSSGTDSSGSGSSGSGSDSFSASSGSGSSGSSGEVPSASSGSGSSGSDSTPDD